MALLNQNGKYIKMRADGSFEIYTSEEARSRVKRSTPGEVILTKYRELLADLETQHERWYYDPDGFDAEYQALHKEYRNYCYNFLNNIYGHEYPIMATYYPDVADSIADIVEGGKIFVGDVTIEDAYINAKQAKRWGETVDV